VLKNMTRHLDHALERGRALVAVDGVAKQHRGVVSLNTLSRGKTAGTDSVIDHHHLHGLPAVLPPEDSQKLGNA
jgi:hypothetical protein